MDASENLYYKHVFNNAYARNEIRRRKLVIKRVIGVGGSALLLGAGFANPLVGVAIVAGSIAYSIPKMEKVSKLKAACRKWKLERILDRYNARFVEVTNKATEERALAEGLYRSFGCDIDDKIQLVVEYPNYTNDLIKDTAANKEALQKINDEVRIVAHITRPGETKPYKRVIVTEENAELVRQANFEHRNVPGYVQRISYETIKNLLTATEDSIVKDQERRAQKEGRIIPPEELAKIRAKAKKVAESIQEQERYNLAVNLDDAFNKSDRRRKTTKDGQRVFNDVSIDRLKYIWEDLGGYGVNFAPGDRETVWNNQMLYAKARNSELEGSQFQNNNNNQQVQQVRFYQNQQQPQQNQQRQTNPQPTPRIRPQQGQPQPQPRRQTPPPIPPQPQRQSSTSEVIKFIYDNFHDDNVIVEATTKYGITSQKATGYYNWVMNHLDTLNNTYTQGNQNNRNL